MEDQDPPTPSIQKSKKKLWLVIAAVVVVIIATALLLMAIDKPKEQAERTQNTDVGSKEFKITAGKTPVKYAGNPVYDACDLLPFDTIRKNVNNYQKLLDMVGTDKKPSDPLTIEHNYIDSDITTPLGKDGQPHPTGVTMTTAGGQQGVSASSFVSADDSNCWYGQGSDLSIGVGKTFAKLYVTQKPTPLSNDLMSYLGTLNKAASKGGLDIYVEPQTDSSGFFTSIISNTTTGAVAILKASTSELGEKATLEVADRLSNSPHGPINVTYPLSWSSMPNACALLTRDDFQQFTSRPASATAEDTITQSEIGGRLMQRSCERLEVERVDGTPISKSNVTVRLASDENAAKKYVEDLKKDNAMAPIKQKINLADEVYIRTIREGAYEINMRLGATFIAMDITVEGGKDTSADAYAARMLPAVKQVAEKLKE